MTGHGLDCPDLAVRVMKKGAVDYVRNRSHPRATRSTGQFWRCWHRISPSTMRPRQSRRIRVSDTPQPFSGGEMMFYPDRVTLCDVTVLERAHPACGGSWTCCGRNAPTANTSPTAAPELARRSESRAVRMPSRRPSKAFEHGRQAACISRHCLWASRRLAESQHRLPIGRIHYGPDCCRIAGMHTRIPDSGHTRGRHGTKSSSTRRIPICRERGRGKTMNLSHVRARASTDLTVFPSSR